ncbi:ABC transporter substrate-binding protein [Streptomyces sp. N2-109]|uniref:ABC transporter substrate-binding protein n=1 Tax=Streptomyces gossypii TaxID=2883101 RepID=A0ABT2JY49_9ACTN|nr:ABC transporter substrate-binding protein [Streptomyces gossypii]MCT2592194.1 ABC transporter substrate-binding protein [Streptomyces gossypii]
MRNDLFISTGNWLYNTFWSNRIRKALTGVLALALIMGAVYFRPSSDPDTCAAGIAKRGGECIGVNGSGYDFGTPEITKVSAAIARENERIAEKPHITVAMMLPLEPKIPAERKQLRSDLQGAYLAQYRVNRRENTPLLRLVLANPGKDYRQQEEVVDALAEMADSQENLRAVTGFNLSLSDTEKAIRRLTNELGIPVLASRVSADGLANEDGGTGELAYDGLARVIPTNRQQADALASFQGDLSDRETVLVRDTRPRDIYVKSLARAFSRDEDGPPGAKDQPFESPGITEVGDTGNDFTTIGHNICQSAAKVVYFAGRPAHLRLFALKLADTPCHGKRYTVISGSGAATLERYMSEADWKRLEGSDDGTGEPAVTVQYSAPAHPDTWDRALSDWEKEREEETGRKPAAKERPAYLTEPQKELRALQRVIEQQSAGDIGPVALEDSRTIMVHDGVRTVAEAVFLANSQTEGSVPPLDRVTAQWARLESRHRVTGASGWICLTNGGNPYDKPVAVVELDPSTRKLAFEGIGWPLGEAQPSDCVVPSGID